MKTRCETAQMQMRGETGDSHRAVLHSSRTASERQPPSCIAAKRIGHDGVSTTCGSRKRSQLVREAKQLHGRCKKGGLGWQKKGMIKIVATKSLATYDRAYGTNVALRAVNGQAVCCERTGGVL
eukprot:2273137-Pleurochrysis_carterae.AAC.1